MDDRLYREALRRKAELQKELEDVEAFLRLAERLFHDRNHENRSEPHEVEPTPAASEQAEEREPRRRNPTPPKQLAELAREEILAAGHPMTRGELVDALEKRGVEMVAKDKAKNLGTILWRFPDMFINMPKEGYWPKDVPPPGKMV